MLANRYRLVERIALGGMGEVWRAHDETLDREVAVKMLLPGSANDEGFLERFRAEARHSGGLTHPNIGTVHDFGEEDGNAFLVMELLQGEPLSTLIRERAPMPQDEVTDILYQAALALQAAHEADVVHRDVKPANIVVDANGYAKLTDFGIARALNEAPLTQTGEVLGTPHYLAPEQAKGEQAGPLSDVYALAVVGYEMITGQRPFSGETMVTTALAHISQPAPPLSDDVAEPLRTTVMASLAKDPTLRPQSAAAFAAALRLPAGEVPEHLVAGAAAAVAPFIVGVPTDLGPEGTLPTSVIPTPAPFGAAITTAEGTDSVLHDTRRPPWLIPAAAALVVLVIIVAAIAFGSRGATAGPGGSGDTATTTQPATTPTTATTTQTTASRTTAPASIATPKAPAHQGKGNGNGKGGKKK
ncbi:serine/threonine protein kinase [Pedococcus bigeumensis]|uniref:non-specific serine/threonine protein kinase n=2 Tax=Pedococcus bigeumensis TaxID=433644 RepID=A0A502CUW7_9MICO|nr:serine/threonine protein kinase [Pedococcus bigeumensis]